MELLLRMVGEYAVEGTVQPSPSLPKMQMKGENTVDALFGGSVVRSHFRTEATADSPAYEGMGYMYWDPAVEAYAHVWVDNMGQFGVSEGRWVDDHHLSSVMSGYLEGQPLSNRSVLVVDDAGKPVRFWGDSMHADSKPVRVAEGTYTPIGGEAARASLQFTAGSCCDRARKAGNSCTHPCCVTAAEAGKVCAACN